MKLSIKVNGLGKRSQRSTLYDTPLSVLPRFLRLLLNEVRLSSEGDLLLPRLAPLEEDDDEDSDDEFDPDDRPEELSEEPDPEDDDELELNPEDDDDVDDPDVDDSDELDEELLDTEPERLRFGAVRFRNELLGTSGPLSMASGALNRGLRSRSDALGRLTAFRGFLHSYVQWPRCRHFWHCWSPLASLSRRLTTTWPLSVLCRRKQQSWGRIDGRSSSVHRSRNRLGLRVQRGGEGCGHELTVQNKRNASGMVRHSPSERAGRPCETPQLIVSGRRHQRVRPYLLRYMFLLASFFSCQRDIPSSCPGTPPAPPAAAMAAAVADQLPHQLRSSLA